jgi:hypothetical protein
MQCAGLGRIARTGAIAFVALVIGINMGCDDRSSSVPPDVVADANKPKDQPPAVPTTQQLLNAPRTRTQLVPLPLSMELPPSWQPMKDAPVANLWEGYTPSGQVQLQLTTRRSISQQDLDRLMQGASREMQQNPGEVLKVELRPKHDLKILERQSVGRPAPLVLYDKNNVPHTTTESIFNWNTSVLVPGEDGKFQVYELNFIGLTRSQYEKDKDFLNSILNTIEYTGSTTQPAEPAGAKAE